MTILKYSVTFVCISLRFVYNKARESELRKKVRTVTRAINMIHKYHAFKTLVIKTLGNLEKVILYQKKKNTKLFIKMINKMDKLRKS